MTTLDTMAEAGVVSPRLSDEVSMPIFFKCNITESVRLGCNELNSVFRETILEKCKSRLEGKCSRHGYIKKDSVEVLHIAPGLVRSFSLNGDAIFIVQVQAEVCNPPIGSIVPGTVVRSNRFGVLATISSSDGDDGKVMEVIIAKQTTFKSVVDLTTLANGQGVAIEIIGKKFSINDNHICGIGKIVRLLDDQSTQTVVAEGVMSEDTDTESVDDRSDIVDTDVEDDDSAKEDDDDDEIGEIGEEPENDDEDDMVEDDASGSFKLSEDDAVEYEDDDADADVISDDIDRVP